MNPRTYWRQPVETIGRAWYDLDKPSHVALIALALAALTPLTLAVSAIVAAVLYFGIGKLLVAIELIPHGAHKSFGAEAIHWIGEIALCALVPAFLASRALGAVACLALYVISILVTPESP